MGKKATKIVEARSKQERKQVRQQLGSLKSLTVQPITKQRYSASLEAFYDYLAREKLALPTKRDKMDALVADYLEFLWSEGEGRSTANNILAALQDRDPKLRGQLPGAWRLLKAWTTHEVPNRAPPLSEAVLRAMVGWAMFKEHFNFGISLLVAFYGMLRTGELLSLQAWQISMVSPCQPAVISLGLTKSGKRQGAAESITVTEISVLKFLWAWKQKATPHAFLTGKPHVWRKMFDDCLSSVKISEWGFRPYSLRRGGATWMFTQFGSLDRVLIAGRWTAVKTARIYINSGLAVLAELKISALLLKPWVTVFMNSLSRAPNLEPTLKESRTGGRGKKRRRDKKHRFS